MANNRMNLVNTRTGKVFRLAKYYPSTGWYINRKNLEKFGEELNDFFEEQDFGHLTEEQRAQWEQSLFILSPGGPAYYSSAGSYGAEYELQLEVPADNGGSNSAG